MRLLTEYIPGSVEWSRIGAIRHFPVRHFPVLQIPVTLSRTVQSGYCL